MKIPLTPPDTFRSLPEATESNLLWLVSIKPADERGLYQHWDKIRHLKAPAEYSNENWWAAIKLARHKLYQDTVFKDKYAKNFVYAVPNTIVKELNWIDIHMAGNIQGKEDVINEQSHVKYIMQSLIEESISSSQLEGASTTRKVAREMLRKARKPDDKSEQMIWNNYRAMQFIKQHKQAKLSTDFILELHKILTQDTLPANEVGQLRTSNDVRIYNETNQILHEPPKAKELKQRLNILCEYANRENETHFIHPIIKAITLHFMLAYDHPFADGNGRTARALFYWYALNQNYWMIEYISISAIIKKAARSYARAFLYTETDENDLTYFLIHQLETIRKATDSLQNYLDNKKTDIRKLQKLILNSPTLKNVLNFRQLNLLKHAIKNPGFSYNINEHKNSHGVAYQTARTDLLELGKLELLQQSKQGKKLVFIAPMDIKQRIERYK